MIALSIIFVIYVSIGILLSMYGFKVEGCEDIKEILKQHNCHKNEITYNAAIGLLTFIVLIISIIWPLVLFLKK